MTEFDLRAAIRDILNDTNLTSPDEIADKVIHEIPQDAVHEVLRLTLRAFVHLEMTRIRSRMQRGTDEQPQPAAQPSAKVRAIRRAAPSWMRERVNLGHGTWKLLGECGYEHLIYLASERMEHVVRNQAAAERYQRYADMVKRYKVKTLSELPPKALQQLDEAAAA